MKKLLWIVAALLLGGLYLYIMTPDLDVDPEHTKSVLPWHITVHADGSTEVLGIRLGQTTVAEMGQRFHSIPEIGVFEDADGNRSMEAYFGRQVIGVLEAKLLFVLDVPEDRLNTWMARHGEKHAQPSGAFKYELQEDDLPSAFEQAVGEIIYTPVADYTQEIVTRRFGEPTEQRDLGDDGVYWLYPNQGLMVAFDEDQRALFHYVKPESFSALLERLNRLEANGA